jgi:signal transduction histidine kinase
VRAVQQAKTGEELTAAVRAFLAQRANSRFFVKYDLPAALVVAEVLAARDDVDPALLHALLREGRQVGTSKIVPIQAQLIERARDLREEDARFLFDRVVEVSERAGVSTLALRARWEELAAPLDLPLVVEGERVFAGLVWAARSRPAEKAWSGVRVPEGRILDDVRADLRARSVLRDDDDIALSVPRDGAAPSDLDVLVRSPRLEGEAALAASRFRVKSGLLGTFTLMAGALVAGLVLDARRRKRYDELRSGFVAAVSHELRTPLASMRLLVESMIARAGDDKTREKLERLGGDVDGLDFLVENILSFSRLERGRLVPRKERVSLVEVAADAAQRARAECPGVVVTVDAADAADVDGDPELLALVVHHLVRNAWQHNPRADRKVSVVVRARAVSVEDNGPGVPEGDRERIFLEFERGRQPSSRGTGLGLALCRQIARAHGGDVTLASTGPGGSTFLLAV